MEENKELILDSTQTEALKRAKRLLGMGDKILLSRHKVNFYEQALKELDKVPAEAEEREQLSEELCRRINHAKAGISIEIYEQACIMEKHAQTTDAFNSAALRFEEAAESIKGTAVEENALSAEVREKYEEAKQSADRAVFCRSQAGSRFRRKRMTTLLAGAVICASAGALVWGMKTSTYHMAVGQLQLKFGFTDSAVSNFKKAYTRHPGEKTHDLYMTGLYEQGMKSYEDGEMEKAAKQLHMAASEGYLDAAEYAVAAEMAVLREAGTGDKLYFGSSYWYVLETDDAQALLLKFDALEPVAFQTDSSKESTWEQSTLRAYLNGAYLEENFTAEEQEYLVESRVENDPNPVYGTDGGAATTDYVYVLSMDEFEQYYDLINPCGHCYWLRTPGAANNSTVFVDIEKVAMDYGYRSTAETMYVKPVIRVNTAE